MSRRFWTSDFHLGMDAILKWENRPFRDVREMDAAYLRACMDRAGRGDLIVHLGDLACFNSDSHGGEKSSGIGMRADVFLSGLDAQFVNVRGNHDVSNRVFSACESMRTALGSRYPDVSASHFPSYDDRSRLHWLNGDVHLCGHVHGKWKHCFDTTNRVMNVNVGVDAWQHRLVSDEELIAYIDRLLRVPVDRLYRCRISPNGKPVFSGGPQSK